MHEQAIEVLRATNDGDDLSLPDLKLVEAGVNGRLNRRGEEAFADLCRRVREGYETPWFHGIEHLTIDPRGYVYWKGEEVEHYESPWAYSACGKAAAEELARRCRKLRR